MIEDSFGHRLKIARKNKGMTQRELSTIVGISSQVISNIERGYTTGLGAYEIKLLSNALDVSSDYLVGSKSVITKENAQQNNLVYDIEQILYKKGILQEGAPLDLTEKEDLLKFIDISTEVYKNLRKK